MERNFLTDPSIKLGGAKQPAAKGRVIADPNEVVRPDITVGFWCGKRFRPEQVKTRPGWEAIPAVRDGEVHEIESADILQPGAAALSDGLRQLHGIVARWAARAA